MLPGITQRLIIFAAVLVGAAGWMPAINSLRLADGADGLSLWTARVGPVTAIALVILCGIPAVAAALVTAATGNTLAGVFSVAASLCVVAGLGGSIDGWIYRDGAGLPGDYAGLMLEVFVWEAALLGTLVIIHKLRRPLSRRLAGLMRRGADTADLSRVDLRSVMAGVLCALIAGILLVFMLRSFDGGQVIWSLITAFLIGAVVARLIVPQSNYTPVLLSPALVALCGYGWMLLTFEGGGDLLQSWHALGRSATNVPGPALALPIHYTSAAVVGCTLGLGWAQGLAAARGRLEEETAKA
jgi:hypothetical protein